MWKNAPSRVRRATPFALAVYVLVAGGGLALVIAGRGLAGSALLVAGHVIVFKYQRWVWRQPRDDEGPAEAGPS